MLQHFNQHRRQNWKNFPRRVTGSHFVKFLTISSHRQHDRVPTTFGLSSTKDSWPCSVFSRFTARIPTAHECTDFTADRVCAFPMAMTKARKSASRPFFASRIFSRENALFELFSEMLLVIKWLQNFEGLVIGRIEIGVWNVVWFFHGPQKKHKMYWEISNVDEI